MCYFLQQHTLFLILNPLLISTIKIIPLVTIFLLSPVYFCSPYLLNIFIFTVLYVFLLMLVSVFSFSFSILLTIRRPVWRHYVQAPSPPGK